MRIGTSQSMRIPSRISLLGGAIEVFGFVELLL
jgi:hypothetical protein